MLRYNVGSSISVRSRNFLVVDFNHCEFILSIALTCNIGLELCYCRDLVYVKYTILIQIRKILIMYLPCPNFCECRNPIAILFLLEYIVTFYVMGPGKDRWALAIHSNPFHS